MPKLKPGHISPTDEEDAAIMAGIAADPDNPELDEEYWATAKSFQEVYPDGIDKPPRSPKELWPERYLKKEEPKMSTVGIDHIAMPTADAERLMAFYQKLGFSINDEAEWRAGTANIFSIQIGDSKINVHPEGYLADYRGPTAVPGCTDICFVWDGSVEDCQQMLADAGVEIVRGPGPRKGARQRGVLPAVSLYARDPDNNLLEWMIYQ